MPAGKRYQAGGDYEHFASSYTFRGLRRAIVTKFGWAPSIVGVSRISVLLKTLRDCLTTASYYGVDGIRAGNGWI